MANSNIINSEIYSYLPAQKQECEMYENINIFKIIINFFCSTKKRKKISLCNFNKMFILEKNCTFAENISATMIYRESIIDKLKNKIDDIYEKYKTPNIEYDEETISISSFYGAKTFLTYFKNDTPIPHVAPYPDGEIGFTWRNENNSYTILFTSDDKIVWNLYINKKKHSSGTMERSFDAQMFLIEHAKKYFG